MAKTSPRYHSEFGNYFSKAKLALAAVCDTFKEQLTTGVPHCHSLGSPCACRCAPKFATFQYIYGCSLLINILCTFA